MLLEERLQQAKVEITNLKTENKKFQITCQQYVAQYDTLQQHIKDLLRKRFGVSSECFIENHRIVQSRPLRIVTVFKSLLFCKMLEDIEALLLWDVSKKKRIFSSTAQLPVSPGY